MYLSPVLSERYRSDLSEAKSISNYVAYRLEKANGVGTGMTAWLEGVCPIRMAHSLYGPAEQCHKYSHHRLFGAPIKWPQMKTC